MHFPRLLDHVVFRAQLANAVRLATTACLALIALASVHLGRQGRRASRDHRATRANAASTGPLDEENQVIVSLMPRIG